jgi:hypothetical protein
MLEWIYDTLKSDFSLDEIIEALDTLDLFRNGDALLVEDLTADSVIDNQNPIETTERPVHKPSIFTFLHY